MRTLWCVTRSHFWTGKLIPQMVGRLSAVRSQLSTLLGNYLGRSLLPHQGHTTFPKDSSYPVIDQSRKARLPGPAWDNQGAHPAPELAVGEGRPSLGRHYSAALPLPISCSFHPSPPSHRGCCYCSLAQSCLPLLWPHGLQHARPPYPSPSPEAFSNLCPLSQWCHPTI